MWARFTGGYRTLAILSVNFVVLAGIAFRVRIGQLTEATSTRDGVRHRNAPGSGPECPLLKLPLLFEHKKPVPHQSSGSIIVRVVNAEPHGVLHAIGNFSGDFK